MTNIYCLKESGIDIVEYVGRTELSLESRLYEHIQETKRWATSKKHKWISEVLSRGGEIEIKLLDVCSKDEREVIEERWIQYYRLINPELKNGTCPNTDIHCCNMSDRIRSDLVEQFDERVTLKVLNSTIVNLRLIYGFTYENRMEVLGRLVEEEYKRLTTEGT